MSITIPEGVANIGGCAFERCFGLTSVAIPSSVTSIGAGAFNDCNNLQEVHISDVGAWCNISFVKYGDYTSNPLYYAKHLYIGGNEIKDLVIPDGVTSIKDDAFKNCESITSVTIPSSVTSIGAGAFNYCNILQEVHISDVGAWCSFSFDSKYANPLYYAKHLYIGVNEAKDLVIPDGMTSIGDYGF